MRLARQLTEVTVVGLASLASFAIALAFIFVWAPHPWGWTGFDRYQDFAQMVARGEAFPTTDQPWGYVYFLAGFYWAFGNRPWIPLLAQAALNASIPVMIYEFARTEFDIRIAVVAAVLIGLCSFNTVYASTQSSDAVCTVLFTAAVVAFARGHRRMDRRWIALGGGLIGLAIQFRPNLLLVPLVLAGWLVITSRRRVEGLGLGVTLVVAASVLLAPWIVRNYRLTHEFLPTSTHAGLQLWYGTLQTGPYLKSRAYNPRAVFEAGPFPYTSLDQVPLVVTARGGPCATPPDAESVALIYWTDRNQQPLRVIAHPDSRGEFAADMAPSSAPTTYYYYLEVARSDDSFGHASQIPPDGAAAPFVYFVSKDHLGDLDRHGDLLDIFDVARMLRHVAWNEPLPFADRLDFDHDGRVTEHDIQLAVVLLLSGSSSGAPSGSVSTIERRATAAILRLGDGSSLVVPINWSGRLTDLQITGRLGGALLRSTRSFGALQSSGPAAEDVGAACGTLERVEVNKVFYRDEPQSMRRLFALAFDNIRRDPPAYLYSVIYRAFRVFIVEGDDDPQTTQQFPGGRSVYLLATIASSVVFVLMVFGVWTAYRRGCAIALPAILIAYVPLTLGFVLTNMRYSITVQPLIFVFVAAAIVSALEAIGLWPVQSGAETPHREDI